MPVLAVIGAQWGDEGKGKVSAGLASQFNAGGSARFSGGPNAGHTVLTAGEEIEFRQLPASALVSRRAIVGNSVVIRMDTLRSELETFSRLVDDGSVFVSRRCHVVTPRHLELDASKDATRLGTTGNGVGPCVSDRVSRRGLRLEDILAKPAAAARIGFSSELLDYATDCLRPIVADVEHEMSDLMSRGAWIIAEGSQGSALDVELGDYPFVTSSHVNIGGVLNGLGVSHRAIGVVVLAATAYLTKLGTGPFPSRVAPIMEERLQRLGAEYDASRQEYRACGWIDLAQIRRAHMLNGSDGLVLTKVDVLGQLEDVRVHDSDAKGRERSFAGWGPLDDVLAWSQVPDELQAFVQFIESQTATRVIGLSTGRETERLIIDPEFKP